MGLIRNIGYVLAAVLVVTVVSVGSLIAAGIAAISGFIFWGLAIVGLVAYGIKDYFESKSDSSQPGKD
jgi:hypothetical protein